MKRILLPMALTPLISGCGMKKELWAAFRGEDPNAKPSASAAPVVPPPPPPKPVDVPKAPEIRRIQHDWDYLVPDPNLPALPYIDAIGGSKLKNDPVIKRFIKICIDNDLNEFEIAEYLIRIRRAQNMIESGVQASCIWCLKNYVIPVKTVKERKRWDDFINWANHIGVKAPKVEMSKGVYYNY